MSRLKAVGERTLIEQPAEGASEHASAAPESDAYSQMLLLALTALGQRFVVALSNLFTLLTAASAFYLWLIALPTLDPTKIVGLSIYSCFVLALNIFGRRA